MALSALPAQRRSWTLRSSSAGWTRGSGKRPVAAVFVPGSQRGRTVGKDRQEGLAWTSAEGSSSSSVFCLYKKKLERRAKPAPPEPSFLLLEDRHWTDTV